MPSYSDHPVHDDCYGHDGEDKDAAFEYIFFLYRLCILRDCVLREKLNPYNLVAYNGLGLILLAPAPASICDCGIPHHTNAYTE
ncbi:hypothetical protein B0H19DRAFT_1272669 [Mycena capillaripes]|nr:hypothetical protein B0H19DRAFT_1272669 [Mycena capillaripes]